MRPDGTTIVHTYTQSGRIATATVNGTAGVQAGKTSYQYDANDQLTRQTKSERNIRHRYNNHR